MSSSTSSQFGNYDENLITKLHMYNACDIADALLKLQIPNAGYLSNLQSIGTKSVTSTSSTTQTASHPIITIAPASTVIFGPKFKSQNDNTEYPRANIPSSTHWVDLTPPETILVLSQPNGQICAVFGGIMALRLKVLNIKGVVVSGRVRDQLELASTGLPIWARGISIIGAAAESRPLAVQVVINIDGTIVKPGDLIFCDSINGVVVIPQERLTEVVDLLLQLNEADVNVKKDIMNGVSVYEAFAKHRR